MFLLCGRDRKNENNMAGVGREVVFLFLSFLCGIYHRGATVLLFTSIRPFLFLFISLKCWNSEVLSREKSADVNEKMAEVGMRAMRSRGMMRCRAANGKHL